MACIKSTPDFIQPCSFRDDGDKGRGEVVGSVASDDGSVLGLKPRRACRRGSRN